MNVRSGHNFRAFTLIEILCVVVIIGIAAAVIVPQIGSRDDLKTAAAARVVMADLIYAQNRAITFQKTHYLQFATAQRKYTVLSAPGLNIVKHPVNLTDYVTTFGASGTPGLGDITLVSASFVNQSGATSSTLAFDDLGTPLAYNTADGSTDALRSGAILVQAGAHKLQINIEPYTGSITVASVP